MYQRAIAIAGCVGVIAGATAGAQDSSRTPFWEGLDPGPHAVGFRSHWVRDWTRTWQSAVDANGHPLPINPFRPVRISVWYPANVDRHAKPMRFGEYLGSANTPGFSEDEQRVRDEDTGDSASRKGVRGIVPSSAGYAAFLGTRVAAYRDAPAERGRFPIIVYSLGHLDKTQEDTPLMEYLASRGFVVVSVAQQGPMSRRQMTVSDPASYDAQVGDLAFAMATTLHELPSADWTHIATMGHSMGGIYGLMLALRLGNVSAVVGLDPSFMVVEEPYYWKFWQAPEFDPAHFRGHLLAINRVMDEERATSVDSLYYADRLLIRVPATVHSDFSGKPMYQHHVAPAEVDPAILAIRSQESAARSYVAVVRYIGCYLDAVVVHDMEPEHCPAIPGVTVTHLGAAPGPTEEDLYDMMRRGGAAAAIAQYRAALGDAHGPLPLRRAVMERILDELDFAEEVHQAAEYSDVYAAVFPDAQAFERAGDEWVGAGDRTRALAAYERAAQLKTSRLNK